jgi:hypothetical protein
MFGGRSIVFCGRSVVFGGHHVLFSDCLLRIKWLPTRLARKYIKQPLTRIQKFNIRCLSHKNTLLFDLFQSRKLVFFIVQFRFA